MKEGMAVRKKKMVKIGGWGRQFTIRYLNERVKDSKRVRFR